MSELLELTFQARGGFERWRDVQSLGVRVSRTGALYQLKGCPGGGGSH